MLNRLSLKCEYSHTYLGGGGSDKIVLVDEQDPGFDGVVCVLPDKS